ncbi:MAG TPA: hypothetical protein VGJ07_12850 [Rugosimonospora sp.]
MERSDPAEFVRALVLGDYEATGRYERRLDEQSWDGFPRFLGIAFFLAVHRRFTGRDDRGEIIRFVADLLSEGGAGRADVDPLVAESVILRVFDPQVNIDFDQTAMGRVQTLVVHKILTGEDLAAGELDSFLGEAERLAAGG